MAETLRWGVVGIGQFLEGTMAPAMMAEPACEIVAAVSRDPARVAAFGERFNVSNTSTRFDELLADQRVDAVYIATPNALHSAQVIAAAQAGKHVFCEKPLALTAEEAAEAVAACHKAGVHLGIDFHNRFLPWVTDAARMIADGVIGEIHLVEVDVGSGPRTYTNWRNDPEMAGMGSIHNVGAHALDFLGVLLDAEPSEVMTMFDVPPGEGEVEMLALILLRYDNGTLAYCNCNETVPFPTNTITIHGSRGRISGAGFTRSRVDGDLTVVTESGQSTTHYPAPNAHQKCLAAFTRSILAGESPSPSGLDGLRSVQLCEALMQSATERRLVEINHDR